MYSLGVSDVIGLEKNCGLWRARVKRKKRKAIRSQGGKL